MATETTIHLVDDIDGSEAAETVLFGLDGRHYEIDLSETNAKELRESLGGFIESGRRCKPTAEPPRRRNSSASGKPSTPAPTVVDKEQSRAIRDWARTNGFTIADRGRIPAQVVQAFNQDH